MSGRNTINVKSSSSISARARSKAKNCYKINSRLQIIKEKYFPYLAKMQDPSRKMEGGHYHNGVHIIIIIIIIIIIRKNNKK